MARNLHEPDGPHVPETIVASVWTLLFVVMVFGKLLGCQSKAIETARFNAPPSGAAWR